MAKATRNVTLNGQDLSTVKGKGWIKPVLPKEFAAEVQLVSEAQKALRTKFEALVRHNVKIDPAKYSFEFGYMFGPSYRQVDAECVAKDAPKAGAVVFKAA